MFREKILHSARLYRVGEVLAVDRGHQWSGVDSLRHYVSPVPWYIHYYANQGAYGCLLDQDGIVPSPKDMEISLLCRNLCYIPNQIPSWTKLVITNETSIWRTENVWTTAKIQIVSFEPVCMQNYWDSRSAINVMTKTPNIMTFFVQFINHHHPKHVSSPFMIIMISPIA